MAWHISHKSHRSSVIEQAPLQGRAQAWNKQSKQGRRLLPVISTPASHLHFKAKVVDEGGVGEGRDTAHLHKLHGMAWSCQHCHCTGIYSPGHEGVHNNTNVSVAENVHGTGSQPATSTNYPHLESQWGGEGRGWEGWRRVGEGGGCLACHLSVCSLPCLSISSSHLSCFGVEMGKWWVVGRGRVRVNSLPASNHTQGMPACPCSIQQRPVCPCLAGSQHMPPPC